MCPSRPRPGARAAERGSGGAPRRCDAGGDLVVEPFSISSDLPRPFSLPSAWRCSPSARCSSPDSGTRSTCECWRSSSCFPCGSRWRHALHLCHGVLRGVREGIPSDQPCRRGPAGPGEGEACCAAHLSAPPPGCRRPQLLLGTPSRRSDLPVAGCQVFREFRLRRVRELVGARREVVASDHEWSGEAPRQLPVGVRGSRLLSLPDELFALVRWSGDPLLHEALGGGDRNRTGVQGFAGPCLNHSATPPAKSHPRASPAVRAQRPRNPEGPSSVVLAQ